jgi:sugar phosphate isomerase/epimerase
MRINGSLYCNGNVVAYSDRRKKKNIVTIDNALDKVLQLRGVYYERIEDLVDERDDLYKGRQLGMIAQEVEEIVPEVVSYAEELDEYALDYPKMVGLLVEAHKDQQEIINNQQEQIDELKKLVNTLMEKL